LRSGEQSNDDERMSVARRVWLICAVAVLLARPSRVFGQTYVAAYFGGTQTRPATITVSQPGVGTSVDFARVGFDGKPLQSPQYYGLRVGRLGGARRIGLEVEFIHLKVIAQTGNVYLATGQIAGVAVNGPVRMDSLVQRYAMTHGLNFIVLNVVSRTPLGSGHVSIISRAGAGPTVPHAETTIDQRKIEQYEFVGFGAHAASGVDVTLGRHISLVAEYKLTLARPEIAVPSGVGRTTALTQHVAVGLAFGLSR
jgi:hypothetical protein